MFYSHNRLLFNKINYFFCVCIAEKYKLSSTKVLFLIQMIFKLYASYSFKIIYFDTFHCFTIMKNLFFKQTIKTIIIAQSRSL